MSPSSAASSAGTWRTLVPVFAACAAIGLQAGVAMPLVPLALEREGADKFTIGVVSAAWAVGMLAFGTRIPALAARLGAARAIVLGMTRCATSPSSVAENSIVWCVPVTLRRIHSTCGVKPSSAMRSASSSTTISTASSCSSFSLSRSMSRSGVATTTSTPSDSASICCWRDAQP